MRLDPNDPPERVEFKGVTYRRMGGRGRYYLSQATTNAGRRQPKGLHVAIWEDANGRAVPAGFEVHHQDHDTFNCDPGNLECLPKSEHRSQPKNHDPVRNAAALAKAREAAKEWHGSDAGLEWHRQHAAESIRAPGVAAPYSKAEPISGICEWCGAPFSALSRQARFCGMPCAGACSEFQRGRRRSVHPHYANANSIPLGHECEFCHTRFMVGAGGRATRFCGSRCRDAASRARLQSRG